MASFYQASLLVVCVLAGIALGGNYEELYNVDDTACMADLQLAVAAQQGLDAVVDAAAADASNRRRRTANPFYPVNNLLSRNAPFGNYYPYGGSPYYNNPYLYSSGLNNLQVYRFFNGFTPAGIVRSSGNLVRTYVRFRSTFADAQNDFRLLPLVNVREQRTTTVSRTATADYIANVYGNDRGVARLQQNGCGLDGFNGVRFPCVTLDLPSLPFQRVVRQFVYVTGFGRPNGFIAK